MRTSNSILPEQLSPAARATEITAILAAAIVRTAAVAPSPQSAVGLGFVPEQSVHATPYPPTRL